MTTSGSLKGGRLGLKGMLAGQGQVCGFQKLAWTRQMSVLRSLAKDKGLTVIWDSLVQPWLDQEDTLRASAVLSSPRAAAGRSTGEPVSASSGSSGQDMDACQDPIPVEVPRTAQDEIMFDIPGERLTVDVSSHPIAGPLMDQLADSIPEQFQEAAPAASPQGGISDHVKSLDLEKSPWQHKKYSPESSLLVRCGTQKASTPTED